jgi:intracellular sulfur oxidation DsrE/DsrF family protein
MTFVFRALVLTLLLHGFAAHAFAQDRVVYHFDSGLEQATRGLINIRNHMDVDPKAKIVVVALDRGIDFLLEDAKDRFGPYDARAQDLMGRGVKFQVCEITMNARRLRKDQFILGVEFVPSGVVQITHLQQKEGYAYLKP